MARLDRLGPAKEVIQVGAVVGREFSYALLRRVVPLAEPELQAALGRMTDAELVYVRGSPPEATYQFKHALVQDAAYESLLRSRRRELHRAIAGTLAEHFPETADAQPEVLAHHQAEAGETSAAVEAWQRAGERAVERSAVMEAVGHFVRACELLETLPETPERGARELGLVIARAYTLQSVDGYASPEVLRAYERARAIGRSIGVLPMPLLIGLWEANMGGGEFPAGVDFAGQLFASAEASGDRVWRCWARVAQGITDCHTGRLSAARAHLIAVADFYDEAAHRGSRSDPMIMALSYGALVGWLLGRPAEARASAHEARRRARDLGKTFDVSWSLFFSGVLAVLLREPEAALRHARELHELASDQRFALFVGFANILEGQALAASGSWADGVERLREGIAQYGSTGQRIATALYLGMLAEAYLAGDRLDQVPAVIARALETIPDEATYQPEILRLRAELQVRSGVPADEVERTWRAALALTRDMGARGYEVRVAMDYARWLHARARRLDAVAILGSACAWFPEADGDTGEMRVARTLLKQLQSEGP